MANSSIRRIYPPNIVSHLSHLFRRFLGSRVDVSNHDEPALSLSVAHSVVFFHILFYSVHPSQFRSAPGSGSWNLSRQDILCYIVFFSPLNMTEPGQSFLREESVYWLYVGIFTDGSISTQYSTGIIRFFTKQIATEGFSTVFGQSRCAL